jgi:diguanylate cyclase (GGDEF)-like protein/PAS domain S-box-containing protein
LALRDVSARRMGDRVLAAGDYLYSALSTVASDATTIVDAEGRRVYVSASLGVMLGYSVADLLQAASLDLVHREDRDLWRSATDKAMAEVNGSARAEVRLLHSNGSSIWIEATVVNLLQHSGVQGVVVHARDIDSRRRMEEELRVQATRDALTGLGNRFALMEKLSALAISAAPGTHALLICDLDGFKAVNDSFGHAGGDRVLVEVADHLESALAETDFAARIGGDEFCVLSQRLKTPADALAFAEKIREAVIRAGKPDHTVGVSIGVVWSQVICQPESLLNAADRAMYVAKKNGANQIELTTFQ